MPISGVYTPKKKQNTEMIWGGVWKSCRHFTYQGCWCALGLFHCLFPFCGSTAPSPTPPHSCARFLWFPPPSPSPRLLPPALALSCFKDPAWSTSHLYPPLPVLSAPTLPSVSMAQLTDFFYLCTDLATLNSLSQSAPPPPPKKTKSKDLSLGRLSPARDF